MNSSLSIGLLGAGGRMGAVLIEQIDAADDLRVSAAIDQSAHPLLGQSLGSIILKDTIEEAYSSDVVIDFSAPGKTAYHAELAARHKTPLVIGTTGLSVQDEAAIDSASKETAIVQAGNFSTGIALMMAAVKLLSERLPASAWDVEILDRHHSQKLDSPSGTALMLGEAVADGRDQRLEDVKSSPYDGVHGVRPTGSIAFAAQRGGAVVGEHDVTFYGTHERLTVSHQAENRGLFAAGALRAARFAAQAKPARYSLQDVLGL